MESIILPFNNSSLELVRDALLSGFVVALPTETVYGLAGNIMDKKAVREIFEIKGRPLVDPLIVHVSGVEKVGELAEVNEVCLRLASKFWPGPLTMILRKKGVVDDLITAGKGTVAIRVPGHPVMRAVLEAVGVPLAAPSANPFGYISPTSPEHVLEIKDRRMKYILDGGKCECGIESTIVDVSDPGRVRILRPGPVTRSQIEDFLGMEVVELKVESDDKSGQIAPGLLSQHYSPRTPLILVEGEIGLKEILFREKNGVGGEEGGSAYIFFKNPQDKGLGGGGVFWLTELGDVEEGANKLYELLHYLDHQSFKRIYCERPPGYLVGVALNDRLSRAAAKFV